MNNINGLKERLEAMDLEGLKAALSNWPNNDEIKDQAQFQDFVFHSLGYKLLSLRSVLDHNLITKEDREKIESFDNYQLAAYLNEEVKIEPGLKLKNPTYVHVKSSHSFQTYKIKVPEIKAQIIIELIKMVLAPLAYEKVPDHLYGHFTKNDIGKLEEDIKTDADHYLKGFTTKIKISNSDFYFQNLKNHVPIPTWLLQELVDSKNLSINSLCPEKPYFTDKPTLEECLIPFWLEDFFEDLPHTDFEYYQYKDHLLVMYRRNRQRRKFFKITDHVMLSLGIEFDSGTFTDVSYSDGFDFLGKSYFYDDFIIQCKPERDLFESFLEYLRSLIETPFETLGQKEKEINRLILAFNLYYGRIPYKDYFEKYLNVLVTSRFKASDTKSIVDVREEINHFEGKQYHFSLQLENCPGLLDLMAEKSWQPLDYEITQHVLNTDQVCSLCGKEIKAGSSAVTYQTSYQSDTVHLHCYEDIYEIFKRLSQYPKLDPVEYDLRIKAMRDPVQSQRNKTIN